MSKILLFVGVASLAACGVSNRIHATLRDALDIQYPACSDAEQVGVFNHGTVEGVDLTVCGVNRRFVSFDGRVTWIEDLRYAVRMAAPTVEVLETESPSSFVGTDTEPAPSAPEPTAQPVDQP